ncbi:MAG TPA: FAD:protein FMN transferase, partial [Actinomycetota bacterium]
MRSRDAHRRRDFRAMGTTVTVLGPDVPVFEHAARRVSETFTVEEDRFSRFRTTSELCRVNAAAGSWTTISEPFAQLLAFSLDQAGRTRGLFDPTVLRAVHAAG